MNIEKKKCIIRCLHEQVQVLLKMADHLNLGAYNLQDKGLAVMSDSVMKVCEQMRDYTLEVGDRECDEPWVDYKGKDMNIEQSLKGSK